MLPPTMEPSQLLALQTAMSAAFGKPESEKQKSKSLIQLLIKYFTNQPQRPFDSRFSILVFDCKPFGVQLRMIAAGVSRGVGRVDLIGVRLGETCSRHCGPAGR